MRFAVQRAFPSRQFNELVSNAQYSIIGDMVVVGASWSAMARKAKDAVSFPADWWEAFKERWFPSWALARWPVVRREFRAQEILPAVAWPSNYGKLSYFELAEEEF